MIIERIITLANEPSRLMFTAMERSLRATGCDLPLAVIPYDDRKFDLPHNAYWLEDPAFFSWVSANCAHPMMRKYLPLTLANYQYLDTDAVFLSDPVAFLKDYQGFLVCDTEWNKPKWTVNESSQKLLSERWSTWQKEIFCAGQYACDRSLYSAEGLQQFAESPQNRAACLEFPFHDQPGTNLFVLSTDVPRLNLTLPPKNMESTWAGDYEDLPTWDNLKPKPYIMHYAGGLLYEDKPINDLFLQFFTQEERRQWEEHRASHRAKEAAANRWPLGVRVLNRLTKIMYPKYQVQPL